MTTEIESLLGIPLWLILIIIVWSLIWKGLALWKSAGRKQTVWFIIILITNTIGILPIIYLILDPGKKIKSNKKKKS